MQYIKEYYLKNYPSDDLGAHLIDDTTFTGLLNELYKGNDIYKYIGVTDSIIRERLFEKLAQIIFRSYNYIYNIWIQK